MADNKISDLPSNAALTDSDLLELEQPGETAGTRSRKGTLATLLAWILGKTHAMTAAINEAKATDIASAATTDIGAATGNLVHITGTTTITALGTVQAGTRRKVVFDGALILTHHATSLILPTGANITTAAGDTAEFISEGSGNWRCTGYLRASGAALVTSGASPSIQTITSSSTVTPVATNDKIVVSAQAAAILFDNPTGTEAEGQGFVIALKDNGTARAITWGANYRAMGAALPTTTVPGKWMYIPVIYNGTDDKWDVLAVSQQA